MFVNSFLCVVVGVEHGGSPFIAQLLKGIADLFRILIRVIKLFQYGQYIGDDEAQLFDCLFEVWFLFAHSAVFTEIE